MGLVVIILAAAYGAGAGLLLPRAAYRLSVEPGEPWRDSCPDGHPLPGWVGRARCRLPGTPAVSPSAPAPGHPGARPGAPTPVPAPADPDAPTAPADPDAPTAGEGSGPPPHRYGVHPAGVVCLVAGVCALLAWAVGARPEAVAFVGLAPGFVLLGLVDVAVHRLPDPLTLPLAAAAVVLLGCAGLLPGAAGSWRAALLGGAALAGSYLVLFLIHPAGMGFGDVKLALSLGVALGWYGWGVWAAGAFLGFLYGAVYGLGLLLCGRAGRRTAFPFGPFMAAGALTGLLLGGFGA
ncbi:prepilin peptidase [Streptomyces sp. NPDC002602]|uniref:prepilin peptidase n=1 Tax=Streptomyces sp. NPDC002602 TaxID=3364654 RepID=UPI0036B68E57